MTKTYETYKVELGHEEMAILIKMVRSQIDLDGVASNRMFLIRLERTLKNAVPEEYRP